MRTNPLKTLITSKWIAFLGSVASILSVYYSVRFCEQEPNTAAKEVPQELVVDLEEQHESAKPIRDILIADTLKGNNFRQIPSKKIKAKDSLVLVQKYRLKVGSGFFNETARFSFSINLMMYSYIRATYAFPDGRSVKNSELYAGEQIGFEQGGDNYVFVLKSLTKSGNMSDEVLANVAIYKMVKN